MSAATHPNRTKLWLVLLEGGQWCWSPETCGLRAQQNPALTTSTVWPPHMSMRGIFDDNPRRRCEMRCAQLP